MGGIMAKGDSDFIKLIRRRVTKELTQQGITGTVQVKSDKRLSTAVAQHIVAQQERFGRKTTVTVTSADEQAEQALTAMLLNKKSSKSKIILATVTEDEIKRYAKIVKLKGVTKREETEVTLLLKKIKEISPDAVFALGK